jgi:hypothetical protein
MKAETEVAIRAAIEAANKEGLVVVGFTVPRSLENEDEFSWSLFKSDISVKDAESLLISLAEVIAENSIDTEKGLVN